MQDPARQQPPDDDSGGRGEALARALAAAHDALATKIALLEAEQAAGTLAPGLAAQQAAAAQAVYERSCALARVAADHPGWETWAGPGGVLYARRLLSSPPWVVRAPSAQALREAIERRCQR
jgi:hypothetical protein